MTLLKVRIYPDKCLITRAKPIEQVDDHIRDIANNMIETMYTEDGIGLAAPQVGISLRMMTVDLSEEKKKFDELIEQSFLSVERPFFQIDLAFYFYLRIRVQT